MIEYFPTLRSRRSVLAALFLLLAAVFFLPYLVPVTPSVSLSYVVGYNNRVAFLILSAGSVLFALLTRSRFPEAVSADQPLGRPSLLVALVIALLACASRLLPLARHKVGGAAMGRCDYGHLIMAAPAFLLGVAAIDARPSLRIWWSPFAIVLIAIPAVTIPFYLQHWPLQAHVAGSAKRAAAYAADPAVFAQHPCPVVYRTLTVAPKSFETAAQDCLDTGRYAITIDAFTPPTVDILLRELERRPLAPLVFHDLPLAEELKPLNDNLTDIRVYELSPWLPRPRNPPFSYQKLQAYVERHYTPSPIPVKGFRIWYPRSDGSH